MRTTSIEIEKLARGAYAFAQLAPVDGYDWVSHDGERWLVDKEPPWLPGQALEFVQPVLGSRHKGDPGLHRDFARLPETEEDIKRFANEHGRLWGTVGHLDVSGEIRPEAAKPRESFSEWRIEIRAMAQLINLWDLAHKGDDEGLREFVEWRRDPTRVHVDGEPFASEGLPMKCTPPKPRRNLAAAKEGEFPIRPKLIKTWEYGDRLNPIRYFVTSKVNQRLEGHLNAAVMPFSGSVDGGEILFFPDTLLGALYLLFALEITNHGFTKICPQCDGIFRTTNRRRDYCSDACKKAGWEPRRGRAKGVASRVKPGEPAAGDET